MNMKQVHGDTGATEESMYMSPVSMDNCFECNLNGKGLV